MSKRNPLYSKSIVDSNGNPTANPAAPLLSEHFIPSWESRMPAELIRAPWLSSTAKTLISVLYTYANKEGIAFPSRATLERDCNLDKRVIRKFERELVTSGLIKTYTCKRKDGRKQNIYRILCYPFARYQKCTINLNHITDFTEITTLDKSGLWKETQKGNKIIVTTNSSFNPENPDNHPDSCDCFSCQRISYENKPPPHQTHQDIDF